MKEGSLGSKNLMSPHEFSWCYVDGINSAHPDIWKEGNVLFNDALNTFVKGPFR